MLRSIEAKLSYAQLSAQSEKATLDFKPTRRQRGERVSMAQKASSCSPIIRTLVFRFSELWLADCSESRNKNHTLLIVFVKVTIKMYAVFTFENIFIKENSCLKYVLLKYENDIHFEKKRLKWRKYIFDRRCTLPPSHKNKTNTVNLNKSLCHTIVLY